MLSKSKIESLFVNFVFSIIFLFCAKKQTSLYICDEGNIIIGDVPGRARVILGLERGRES